VLTLVAFVGFGSAALTLAVSHLLFAPDRAAQPPAAAPVMTVPVAAPRPEAPKANVPPPAPDTLAVLPFEVLFEPTPKFRHEVEKLNEALPELLADAGKLRVKPLARTAPLRYRPDPVDAARELGVRAVLVVKFTTEAAVDVSTCHLELIDATTGFLLWGMEVEAKGGFLKHPERLSEVRRLIVEHVPKRMAPLQ
jgi:hypothetical protein